MSLGLPWWAAIAASTATARLALVPATIVARRAARRLASAAPDVRRLTDLLVAALRNSASRRHHDEDSSKKKKKNHRIVKATALYAEAVHATLRLRGANPLAAIFLMPAVHVPTFVAFAMAVRELPVRFGESYSSGGCLWFVDLAAPDTTGILPLAAIAGAYLNLGGVPFGGKPKETAKETANETAKEPSSQGAGGLGLVDLARHAAQLVLLTTLPVTLHLPSGFLVYWITSTAFTFVSTRAFREADLRRAAAEQLKGK